MEPLKIQIEVSLSKATLEVIKNVAVAISSTIMTKAVTDEVAKETVSAVVEAQKDLVENGAQADPAKPAEPKKNEAAAPVQEQLAAGDLPESDVITDDLMAEATRKAVAGCKSRGESSTRIRTEIFTKYGIAKSAACPQDKRAALYEDLKTLW